MKKMFLLVFLLLLCTVCFVAAEAVTYSGACDPIVINQPGEHTIVLDNATIHAKGCAAIKVEAPATKLTIILKDGTYNALYGGQDEMAENGYAAIDSKSTALVIRCERAGNGHVCDDRCGKLNAEGGACGGRNAPTIGSIGTMSSSVCIDGGDVVVSSLFSTGIGSFRGDMTGSVTINGGTVSIAAEDAPCIGSYGGDMTGTVTVNGGIVNIHNLNALGVGSYNGDMSGSFTVRGGVVKVYSESEKLPAIGAGGTGTVTGNAVVCVDPITGWMKVKAGQNGAVADALAGSPYNAYTDLKALLDGKSYAEFRPAEGQTTPAPVTPAPVTPTPVPQLPATSDSTDFALLAALALIGMIGMTVILRKRNET